MTMTGSDIKITAEVLFPDEIINNLREDDRGAIVAFIGTVRDTDNNGNPVKYLEIRKAGNDSLAKLKEVALQVQEKWKLRPQDIIIHRRTGRLTVGVIALVVGIAAPHRQEAFEACAYIVDMIKAGGITTEKDLAD
jgi:molybdopterin synthase catalytic subunit